MNNPKPQDDFSLILAAAVHDMKNSLGMLISSLNEVVAEADAQLVGNQHFASLQYEASRINSELIHLLSIYRMQNRQMPFNVDHHFLEDVLGDQLARSEELLSAKGIEVAMDCAPELDGYFDADLLGSVINDAIINASRYTKSKIQLSAEPSNDGLMILVSDDGTGFPGGMLGFQSPDSRPSVYDHGQTNLGLYLAARVAAQHERQGIHGTLELANDGRLGGAEYRLWLP